MRKPSPGAPRRHSAPTREVAEFQIHATESTHAERIVSRDTRDAGAVHGNEKGADAPATKSRLRRGKDDDEVSGLGVGDPDFAPVQHVAVIVEAATVC